jgi:hypothetical protein
MSALHCRRRSGFAVYALPWVLVAACTFRVASAIIFDVPGFGAQECFERTLHADAHVMVHYAPRHPAGSKVNIRVDSGVHDAPDAYNYEEHDSPGGVVNFHARASTTYHICLSTAQAQAGSVAVAVHTHVTGEYVPLDENIKIGRVRDAEQYMHSILETANRILWEQSFLSETALRRDDASMRTARHARNLALLEFLLALIASAGHAYYLKNTIRHGKIKMVGRIV